MERKPGSFVKDKKGALKPNDKCPAMKSRQEKSGEVTDAV